MGAGKRYSAGAIFLQVVPVFANVQKEIEREAEKIDKSLGDKMEQSGDRAGRRAGKAASKGLNDEFSKGQKNVEREFRDSVERMGDELGNIPTNRLSNSMRKEITKVKAMVKELDGFEINGDVDVKKGLAELEVLATRIKKLKTEAKVNFKADFAQVLAGIYKTQGAIKDMTRETSTWENSFKRAVARSATNLRGELSPQIKRIRDDLIALSKLRIGIDISAEQATREAETLRLELDHLSNMRINPEVDLAVAGARTELREWNKEVTAASARDINVDVDLNTAGARAGLLGLKRDGEDVSNSFRSFNFVLLAAAGAGPALIPILGAIAGGLLAIAPAAAVAVAGLTAVVIGFSGIGGALQALQAKQDQMAKSTNQSAKTEASSARAVARARESAADAVESALDRQVDAQRRYSKSIEDVKAAELSLLEARAAAKDDGKQLDLDIRNNQLDLDQGLIDSFDATVNFNAVMSDGSATNKDKEQARIQMEQAKLRLEELRLEQKRLAEDKKKWDKEGVNGTDKVKSAQEQLNDAIDRQKDAYRALGDAAEAVDEARRDGAQRVTDALAAQADALGAVNAQQANVDAAFDKLGLSGQKFALFLFDLKKGFRSFRDDIQKAMLPGVQSAIEGFLNSSSGKVARDALIALAGAFGRFAEALSKSFQGQAWMGFFEMLRDIGPDIQAAYGDAFIKLFEAFASIMTTAAPFALEFAEGLAAMMTAFADWAASKDGQEDLLKFLAWVEAAGPAVLEFFGKFISAMVNLGEALAPFGMAILGGITDFLGFIANMDPKVLGAIGAALLTLLVAQQVAVGLQAFAAAMTALLSGTLGPVVFLLIGLAAAFVYLYNTNDKFKKFVDRAWKQIAEAFSKAWDDIKPALESLMDSLNELWKEVLEPFLAFLAPILLWIFVHLIPIIAKIWAIQIRAMAWIVTNVWIPILTALGDFFVWLWNDVLKPTWDGIKWGWDKLMDGLAWAWENVLEPALDAMGVGLNALEDAFQAAVDGIAAVWRTLRRIVATPIKFLLETVINDGLIAGFNEVASWVGLGGKDGKVINDVPVPKGITKYSYATGGVMPGYTPGRDVHQFYSPTAGGLELSGGEAIMRPEWTAAMGKDGVDYWNALARNGGVNAVKQAMGMSFWKGGVLPLMGGRFAAHKKGQYPGFAGDLNYGSGYDDYGMPVHAWKNGVVAQKNFIGDQSYGRWMVLNHGGGQNSLYAHLSQFAGLGIGEKVKAGQVIGNVGDLGNTGTPPTSHLHFEINGGAVDYADNVSGGGKSIPGWIMNLVTDPLGYVKHLITDPMKDAAAKVTGSPMWPVAKRAPLMLAEKATDKFWDIIPGWVKTAAGWAGDAAGWVVGGVKNVAGAAADVAGDVGHGIKSGAGAVGNFLGLADGGILPYNGTMKYDAGGYLPPGLTSVVNLTGKPEPVFTHDQWDGMEGGVGGGGIHYEPHFEGSNLTAEDVAGDMNFTFRRLGRSGKYGGVGG